MDLMSDHVYEEVRSIFQRYDAGLRIYNAASFGPGSFVHQEIDRHLAMVKINAESVAKAVHLFTNRVKEQNRTSSGLILMSSTLGEQESGYVASYSANKSLQTVLSHSLGGELRPTLGMDVLSRVAGPISTPDFYRHAGDNDDPVVNAMMQQSSQVAEECLQSLGRPAYSIATGVVQKVLRFMSNRVLPHKLFVVTFTEIMKANHGPKD
jgi:short-subunit dehydrogenase